MANNVDLKDFTLGTARTMKTRETSGVNTPLHQIEDSTGAEVMGTTADAVVAAGAAGSIGAKLRRLTADIGTLIASIANTTSTGWLAVNLRKSDGTEIAFNANGSTTDSASSSVAFSTEGKAQLGSLTETAPASDTASSGLNGRLQRIAQRITSLIGLLPTALGSAGGLKVDDIFGQYKTVAASQTAQAMGATGATGDYLAYVEVFPGAAGCGVVTILDNATTWGTFAGGGTTALPSLVPFRIDVGAYSVSGAWKITTGANVTAVGVGKFT